MREREMGFKSLLLVSSHAPYSVLIVPPPHITLALGPCSVVPGVFTPQGQHAVHVPRGRVGGGRIHVQVTTCPGRTAGSSRTLQDWSGRSFPQIHQHPSLLCCGLGFVPKLSVVAENDLLDTKWSERFPSTVNTFFCRFYWISVLWKLFTCCWSDF